MNCSMASHGQYYVEKTINNWFHGCKRREELLSFYGDYVFIKLKLVHAVVTFCTQLAINKHELFYN